MLQKSALHVNGAEQAQRSGSPTEASVVKPFQVYTRLRSSYLFMIALCTHVAAVRHGSAATYTTGWGGPACMLYLHVRPGYTSVIGSAAHSQKTYLANQRRQGPNTTAGCER